MPDTSHLPPQVFQRREDGSVNFFRGWEAYRDGFGKLTGEHWLGAWDWQGPLLGGLAKPGVPQLSPPAPRGIWGLLCKGKDTETPLASTHVLGVTAQAGGEGTGWLHRAKEAVGLRAEHVPLAVQQ